MVIPQWKRELFKAMTEKLFSELGNMTEGQLRDLRNELSVFEVTHAFKNEASRNGVRLYVSVIGALLLRT